MNDYKNFTEHVVRPELSAGRRLAKVLLVLLYTVITTAYIILFWLNFKSWALLIMLPFIMYAIIRITWRFTNIEYEYAIEAGELTVSVIFDGASRRIRRRAYIPDMTLIAPYDEQRARQLEANDILEVKNYAASPDSENAWVCVYPDKSQGKKRAVIIDVTDEMLRIMRLCNPSAIVRS